MSSHIRNLDFVHQHYDLLFSNKQATGIDYTSRAISIFEHIVKSLLIATQLLGRNA